MPDSISVLHVDDDPGFVEVTAEFLERQTDSLAVITETSPTAALDRLEEEQIDCIVSDFQMPEMDGLELLEAVRDEYSKLPFILFTGKGSEEIASEAITAGVTDYLQKGKGSDLYTVLANRIQNAVGKWHAERDTRRAYKAMETANEGISLLNKEGRFIYVNESYADIYGYDPDELIGEHWKLLYHDEDIDQIESTVIPQAYKEGSWSGETRGKRKDGSTIIEDHSLAITDDGNLICTVRDITDHKEHQQELERSKTILEAIGDPVYALDANGHYTYVNDGYATELGYSKDEIIGEHFSTVLPEHEVEKANEIVRELLANDDQTQATVEQELITADGNRVQMETRIALLPYDKAGNFNGTAGVIRNITDRKQREWELERYETIMEALGDPVYAIDADGYYTFVNDAFTSLTGYSEEQLLGEHTSRVVEDSTVKDGMELTRELLRTNKSITERCELEIITADGQHVPCENHVALLPFDEEGEFRGTAGVIRDISERKQREQTLEQLHGATRDLMAATDRNEVAEIASETAVQVLNLPYNGVHLYDPNVDALVPVAWSDSGEELLGNPPPAIPAGEGLVWDVYESGTSQTYTDVREEAEVLNPETPYRSELHLSLDDHGVLLIGSTSRDDFDANDEILAQVLAANVEAALNRVEREQALHRKNEQLNEFASFVSHDLRNPLNVADGRVELARQECDSDHLDAVAQAHDRMESIIDGLLTLTCGSDQIEDIESIAIGDIAKRCWQTIGANDARLVVETDQTIAADPESLKQLLENLFHNAINHGGPDVTVRVSELEDETGFYVEDNGPGIPVEDRERVLEAGYTTAGRGTGFGLSIVNRITEAHGWDVSITEGTDGGARFEFRTKNHIKEASSVLR